MASANFAKLLGVYVSAFAAAETVASHIHLQRGYASCVGKHVTFERIVDFCILSPTRIQILS